MRFRNAKTPQRRGVASVELAALLPLLVLLLLGTWEVGRLVDVQQSITNAAREGGRQASTGTKSVAQVQQAVTNYLARAGLPTTNVVVTVSNATDTSRPEPYGANQLDRFRVDVTMPFNDVRWVMINNFTSGYSIRSKSVWMSNRDIPVTLGTAIPNG